MFEREDLGRGSSQGWRWGGLPDASAACRMASTSPWRSVTSSAGVSADGADGSGSPSPAHVVVKAVTAAAVSTAPGRRPPTRAVWKLTGGSWEIRRYARPGVAGEMVAASGCR